MLLFQDIAVIPLLVVLPLLATVSPASGGEAHESAIHAMPAWAQGLVVLAGGAVIIVGGRFLLRPVFRYIAPAQSLRRVETLRLPHLEILARAIDHLHAYDLMKQGVAHIRRETLGSSLDLSVDVLRTLGAHLILDIENHHNFAWKETHVVNGETREVIVHRKGATPAGTGVLGIIPGSMASPGYVVRGKGSPESLNSASHGAGRVMSRTKAMQSFTLSATKKLLAKRGVELLSAGLDEVPGVYKDVHAVMAAQTDLVEVLGQFDPKLVKMCPPGDRAED